MAGEIVNPILVVLEKTALPRILRVSRAFFNTNSAMQQHIPKKNPFSSCFMNPEGQSRIFLPVEKIGKRWQTQKWWGELVGPHGTGKTTLLHALLRWAEAQGIQFRIYTLHDGQRRLPQGWASGTMPDVYVIDGAEQLSWLSRTRLVRHCRRQGCGLLITTHASLGLPELYTTLPADAATLRRVVEAIAGTEHVPNPEIAQQLVKQHQGNLRLMLFDLYDQWEAQRRPL